MNKKVETRLRTIRQVALSYFVSNGISAALGFLLISACVQFFLGPFAAAVASIGVLVVIPPDQPGPRNGKLQQMLPAALIGWPLFVGMQLLRSDFLLRGALLVPASFVAFLGAAWGARGLPISISIMFAMIFSLAIPDQAGQASIAATSAYFALGAGAYVVFATLSNALLNSRYRVQMLADTLLALARLTRTQARQFVPVSAAGDGAAEPPIGQLMREQAALTDQLQTARNILLESPDSAERQRKAAMLIQVIEMRDHLVACELDLDTVRSHPELAPVLLTLRAMLESLADTIERLSDALLMGRTPPPAHGERPKLEGLPRSGPLAPGSDDGAPSPIALAQGLVLRVGRLNDETMRLVALARGELDADLAIVRDSWHMFVSPTNWSWRPFVKMWRWRAPPLRHAIRAALAIAAGYAVSLALPWGTHPYWILVTIVVVLRGSVAQTVERRNSRVAGTVIGCLLTGGLLAAHPPRMVLLATVTLAQGVAHAFAIRRYLFTAVAATMLGLVQAHMLSLDSSPAFDLAERLADTLIGAALAWSFSYVLPTWERSRIPALVSRVLASQARHARLALGLGQLNAVDDAPELEWRLARREAYDSLSALVQATQQSLAEPRAVRPPLAPLERIVAHGYQMIGQLTAAKTMLLRRRDQLQIERIREPLARAIDSIDATLVSGAAADMEPTAQPIPAAETMALPEPFGNDLNPWLMRRIGLVTSLACLLHSDADATLRHLKE